jgi:hypothetical protein
LVETTVVDETFLQFSVVDINFVFRRWGQFEKHQKSFSYWLVTENVDQGWPQITGFGKQRGHADC